MDDLLTRFEQIPADRALAALDGLLTLSLFGAPRFGRPVPEALADRGSIYDRWKLFAWLPFGPSRASAKEDEHP